MIKVSAIVSCYKGEKYLRDFLKSCVSQSIKNQLEVVLVHNDPSVEQISLVNEFISKNPGLINHIIVSREPLAVSTNRAIKAALGQYVCIWNIDDLRSPNSLELMVNTLDKNPYVDFTYGDFIIVHKWLEKKGELITLPEFNKKDFSRSMFLGPFYMWRKSWCAKHGYWDEQFKSGADFDHSIRLAIESEGKKTHGLLGYYLDEGMGLSTGRTPWQPIERTFIELRYGIYSKLDFWYYARAKKYNLHNLLQDGKWIALREVCPNFNKFSEGYFGIILGILRYPFYLAKAALNKFIRKYYL